MLFYNEPAVKKALNAPEETTWQGCAVCIPGWSGRYDDDWKKILSQQKRALRPLGPSTHQSLFCNMSQNCETWPGIQVLIYNGDRAMSTCAQGPEMLLDGMEWRGTDEWRKTRRVADVGG